MFVCMNRLYYSLMKPANVINMNTYYFVFIFIIRERQKTSIQRVIQSAY